MTAECSVDAAGLAAGVVERAELFRSILESSTEYSIVAEDLEGTIVAWNEGARRIYGYDPADVVGVASAFVLDHPDDVTSGRARTLLDDVRELGTWSGELRRIRKGGDQFLALVTITLRHDTVGRPVGFTIISRDLAVSQPAGRGRREPRNYNRSLFETFVNAVFIIDPDLCITDVNAQTIQTTGWSRDELVGSPFKDYFTDPARAVAGARATFATGSLLDHELVLQGRLGTRSTVVLNGSTFKDGGGRVVGVVLTARDITIQLRLEQQISERNRELTETTAFLNNVLESSTEYSIIAKDLDGKVLSWNEGARRNYGYTSGEIIGQNSRVLHAAEDVRSGRVDRLFQTVLDTGQAEGVFERVRKTGQRFTASLAITLRHDASGKPSGYVLISKDITEQQRLEAQLRRKHDELEAQNQRIQDANRLKSEFLANMSHELRTPLNGIIGLATLMHDEKVGAISADHKDYLGDILSSSRHLLRLINDVLDLAKVESGKLEFRPVPVDLEQMVEEVCGILRTVVAEKRIRLSYTVDPGVKHIIVDPSKLKQVLYNYLSNALKFTADEGCVSVRALPEGLDLCRLEVEDTGRGIRAADLGQLFVEFQQLDGSYGKQHQGTGLGLALTRRIVEAQGGRVGVTSTLGRGSTFFAVLPRVSTAIRIEAGGPGPVTDPGPTVLVVEDDPKDRAWIVSTLSAAGYAVEPVASGEAAARAARARAFDCVTLDLMLPDMLGWEALRGIRETSLNRNIPAIVMTVLPDRGAGVGFEILDFLLKPTAPSELLDALAHVVAPAGSKRSLLIVDDDIGASTLAALTLQSTDFDVTVKLDGESGLIAAREQPPSAILLDLMMPGMNGFEFLHQLRSTERGRTTPVIVCTAKDLTHHERMQLETSAQAIIQKGAESSDEFLAQIQRCIPRSPGPHGR